VWVRTVSVTKTAHAKTAVWALVLSSRPSQLLLIVLVYGLGVVIGVARGTPLDVDAAAAGVAVLLPVAASVHYANEYADYETDALTTRTPFSGGSGALQTLDVERSLALRAAAASVLVGAAGAVWCLSHGLEMAALAVLAVIAVFGWLYSVSRFALSRHGLGELDNAALGGLALPLYGFAVQTGRVAAGVVLACLPFALVVFVNLLETQWPDREADAATGKHTLVVRLSQSSLRIAYVAVAAAAVLSLPILAGPVLPPAVAAVSVVVVPLLAWGSVSYTRRETPFPAVAAMVLLAVVQLVAWSVVAGLL
jgi:1,4-dihydroxy-2-naphthoate octaprenyltransferase